MKDLALFTIAQDELDLLPVWVAHHKRVAPTADMFILDHDSVGDAARQLVDFAADGVTVVPVHHALSFDYGWLTRTVQDFIGFLLQSYRWVGFCETDELLWLQPSVTAKTLEAFLASQSQPFLRAHGWCLVHKHLEEPDLDWTRPILPQRQHWYRSERYSKICLMRERVYYNVGFHTAVNVPKAEQPVALGCLHLHQADYKTTLRRHQRNAGRVWSPDYRLSPCGSHQRLDNPGDLERYLLCNLDAPTEFATLEPIPTNYSNP